MAVVGAAMVNAVVRSAMAWEMGRQVDMAAWREMGRRSRGVVTIEVRPSLPVGIDILESEVRWGREVRQGVE